MNSLAGFNPRQSAAKRIEELTAITAALQMALVRVRERTDDKHTAAVFELIEKTRKGSKADLVASVADIASIFEDIPGGPATLIQELRSTETVIGDELSKELMSAIIVPESETQITTLLVCPADPTHYSKRSPDLEAKIVCPLHNVLLVPEDAAK